MELIFITKELSEEIKRLKKQNRDFRNEIKKLKGEPIEEIELEPTEEDIDEIVSEEIIEPVEMGDLEDSEKEVEPTETIQKQDRETLLRTEGKELPVEINSHEHRSLSEKSKDLSPIPKVKFPPQLNDMLKETLPIDNNKIIPEEISKYPCPFCDKIFPNKGLLTAHIKRIHGDEIEESP